VAAVTRTMSPAVIALELIYDLKLAIPVMLCVVIACGINALLGQSIYTATNGGDIFVAPHLRVLHVSREATIMRTSFLENIVMNNKLPDVGGMDRVRRICRRIGFAEILMQELDNEYGDDKRRRSHDTTWVASLSHTDYARLNLARVFVGNPEVLVMHKPVATFDDREREHITDLLREHVDEKGIELSESKFTRRPRTLFFTSSTTIGVKKADLVYKVSLKDGVRPIPKESVSHGLLM